MITACFARALQKCIGRPYMSFLFIFQAVSSTDKTCNQLMECAGEPCEAHAHAVLCSTTACPPMVLKAPRLAAVHGVYPRQDEKRRHA